MRFGWAPQETLRRIRNGVAAGFGAWILAYAGLFRYEPFSADINNLLARLFILAAAFLAALFATMNWRRYARPDAPRRIWRPFAAALWIWIAGELSHRYLPLTLGDGPVSLTDVFRVISYLFLGLAVLHQSRLVSQPGAGSLLAQIAIGLFSLYGLALVFQNRTGSPPGTLGFPAPGWQSFYPAADLLLGAAALYLAWSFRGGVFSRPWSGLLALALARLVHAWSLAQGDLPALLPDAAYFGSFLLLGFGFFSQWLFLKYGLRVPPDAR